MSDDDRTAMGSRGMNRRQFLQRAGLATAAFAVPNALMQRAWAGARTSSLAKAASAAIPQTTITMGVEPYGDHSVYVIGMAKGWYSDVGINITPKPYGLTVYDKDVVPDLVSGRLQMSSMWGPYRIQTAVTAPTVKMLGFADTYTGTYILAAPHSGAKSVDQFIAEGKSFLEAMNLTMSQLIGKPVAFDNEGSHLVFFDTAFQLSKVSTASVHISTLDDNRIVELARGGHIEFASPQGAAQNVELLEDGWYPILSAEDLVVHLPPADPRAVGTLGHTGPGCVEAFYAANSDLILRFASVLFRITDYILTNPKGAGSVELPILEHTSGTAIGLNGIVTIYTKIDPMMSFETQHAVWLEPKSPVYFGNIYGPQVTALKKAGLLPKSLEVDLSKIFLGQQVYRDLLDYKNRYDELKPHAGASVLNSTLGVAAATQYAHRDYLDAYKFLSAAKSA